MGSNELRSAGLWTALGAALLSGASAGCSTLECDGACRDYDAEAYDLRGRVDWTQKELVATEAITLSLRQPQRPVIELDAAVNVTRVYAGAVDLPYTVDAAAHRLRVDLGRAMGAEGSVTFAVDYRAPASEALRLTRGENVDPVTSRVAFTFSEPERGKSWLVANHDPADRARFSVELRVERDEDLIANGERVKDEACGGGRCVRYRIDQPLPTYVMAFAAGQLEHEDGRSGAVPLGVWHRRGLLVDSDAVLAEATRDLETFERLLGPYPWSRYSVVFVPEFVSGEENVTIGFVNEGLVAVPDYGVFAHELAHQWFGDWVTVKSFDDLWIKEGMANVLELEPARGELDESRRGRLFGSSSSFEPGDAIRDRSLPPEAKYTSGPYGRAGWLLTQIRRMMGEEAFWSSLRGVLRAHALGAVGSEDFVRSFAPALGEDTIAKILRSLDDKTGPEIVTELVPNGAAGTTWTLHLSDPGETIIAPVELTTVDALGHAETRELRVGTPLALTIPPGGYVAPNERDVHPFLPAWDVGDLLIPEAPPALAAFADRSPSHQETALLYTSTFPRDPAALAALHPELDSEDAREYAEIRACGAMRELPPEIDRTPWIEVLGPLLSRRQSTIPWPAYGDCGADLATRFFLPELSSLADNVTAKTFIRLLYLANFDYGVQKNFEILSKIAAHAPSEAVREIVTRRLTDQITERHYGRVPDEDVPQWTAFFRDRLAETNAERRLVEIANALAVLADDSAATALGQALRRTAARPRYQARVVCIAYKLSLARPAAWSEFQTATMPWDTLSPEAQAALHDPTTCR